MMPSISKPVTQINILCNKDRILKHLLCVYMRNDASPETPLRHLPPPNEDKSLTDIRSISEDKFLPGFCGECMITVIFNIFKIEVQCTILHKIY